MSNSYLHQKYTSIIPSIQKQFNLKNVHEVPTFSSLVVSSSSREFSKNKKSLLSAIDEMQKITSRKPVVTYAKKSISNFGTRQGYPIGLYVTLRKEILYHFLAQLQLLTWPRIPNFKGFSKTSIDCLGNWSSSIPDQSLFPEQIKYDEIQHRNGFNISLSIKNSSQEKTLFLLQNLEFPIK